MTHNSPEEAEDGASDPETRRTKAIAFFALAEEHKRARTTTERHGAGTLTLIDGMPEKATGYLLDHDRAAGPSAAVACRVAPEPKRMFVSREPAAFDPRTLGEAAVWTRPLAPVNGITPWRRGRLRVEPDALVFRDEPEADIEDPTPPKATPDSSIEQALLDSDAARAAARKSGLWCSLLYGTLNSSSWRHRVSGKVDWCSGRSLGALVALLRGEGDYLDWYAGPYHGQDEMILALLSGLGWEPVADKGKNARTPPAPLQEEGQ